MTPPQSGEARRAVIGMLLVIAFAGGCTPAPAARTIELSGPAMGARWSVKVVPEPGALAGDAAQALDGAIRDDLARIDLLMSTWDAESELSRFNQQATTDPFPVSAETFEVFRWSIELAALTGGALDVTVAPLVEAWGFGPAAGRSTGDPDEATIARLRGATGVRHLALDPDGQWVRKTRPDVRVDFSSLAPGYAADRLVRLIEARSFANFLVDVGGELVARGRNERGEPWQVAVERPDARGRVAARVVPVSNAAIATSGDYRNYREAHGRRLTHILDPRSGRPIQHRLASVTIVDSLAVRADGLATALMVLGPDEGLALAERTSVAALLLVRRAEGGFEERMSARFRPLLGMSVNPEP